MESKFAEESQNQYKNLHKSYRSGNVIKNAEEDDFFELIGNNIFTKSERPTTRTEKRISW